MMITTWRILWIPLRTAASAFAPMARKLGRAEEQTQENDGSEAEEKEPLHRGGGYAAYLRAR